MSRIQSTVEEYLSYLYQSVYRQGRSTSDVLWYHRFLTGRVQKFQEEIMIIGIDVSSFFKTIKRTKLIEILESFLLEDEIRIIRIILSNTTS